MTVVDKARLNHYSRFLLVLRQHARNNLIAGEDLYLISCKRMKKLLQNESAGTARNDEQKEFEEVKSTNKHAE